MGQENAAPLQLDPKPHEAGFSAVYSNFEIFRPEVAGDAISMLAVDYAGMDVYIKFGDSTLNNSQIIRLFFRPHPFYALLCSI